MNHWGRWIAAALFIAATAWTALLAVIAHELSRLFEDNDRDAA